MTRQTPAGVDDLVSVMLTASRALVAVSVKSLAEVEDAVTLTQFRTLVVLESNDQTNLNGLADALGVNSSTAMRMIDRLLAADLVTRRDNPANRREVVLGLTRQGQDLVRKVTARRRAEIARIVKAMPDDQRDAMVSALRAFTEAAGEPDAAPFGW